MTEFRDPSSESGNHSDETLLPSPSDSRDVSAVITLANARLNGRASHDPGDIEEQIIRRTMPEGVAVVSEEDRVLIQLGVGGMLFFDLDDTLFDTIEPVHDGPTGCYARVVRPMLEDVGLFFSNEKWAEFWQTKDSQTLKSLLEEHGRVIPDQEWTEFWQDKGGLRRICTGKGLTMDSQTFSEALSRLGVRITPQDFAATVTRTQLELLKDATENFKEIPGAPELMDQARKLGIKLGLCSSSPAHLINGLIDAKSLNNHFAVVICDAEKRTIDGGLCCNGTKRAIEQAEAVPRASCMVGDSISDVSAALSEFGTVIVRVDFEDPKRDQKIINLIESINRLLLVPHGAELLGNGAQECTVIIIGHYDQVLVGQSDDVSHTTFQITPSGIRDILQERGGLNSVTLPETISEIVDPSGM